MSNILVRQLTIDLITDTPNEISTWFNGIWSNMNILKTNVFNTNNSEIIYYKLIDGENQWCFYINEAENIFWCNYANCWLELESKFNLKYGDIQIITKVLVENVLNDSVTIPYNSIVTPVSYFQSGFIAINRVLNNYICMRDLKYN